MFKNIKSYANIFWQMFKMDLIVFKKNAISGIVDTMIWVSVILAVVSYIFPLLGMTQNFGEMWLVGTIVSCCVFEIWVFAASFIADREGNNTIAYLLALPIPSWLVFLKFVASTAFKTSVYTILVIPLGKLIIWNKMDLSNFAPIKFFIMFLTVNIFFGFFSLLMTTIPETFPQIRKVWTRIVFPLWFLSGVEFPWYIVRKLSPNIAYAFLVNPMIYAMEGIRATVLGQANYLNFWICLPVLWLFAISFCLIATFRLRRKLDLV